MAAARSAAAQCGVCDEPKLVMDVLAQLVGAQSVSECIETWNIFVKPVVSQLSQDTISQLERAIAIRVFSVSPRE